MIDFLMRLHPGKEIRLDMVIGPTEIKIEISDRLGLHKPFIFLGNMLDNSILSFYIDVDVQLTLITILFFLLANWFL